MNLAISVQNYTQGCQFLQPENTRKFLQPENTLGGVNVGNVTVKGQIWKKTQSESQP